jgi:polysaccharide biosynthesis protein PslG
MGGLHRLGAWICAALVLVAGFNDLSAAAPTEDPRDSPSPYGVLAFMEWDHDWNNYFSGGEKLEKTAAKMQEAGVMWVRTVMIWADIEPEKGRFDFRKYDHILDVHERHGLKTLAVLAYNPAWRDSVWNAAPEQDAFIAYSRAVVRHFKNRVKYWEVWNEPDQATYWTPQDDFVAYGRLLRALRPVIREEDPSARIVMGAMVDEIPFRLRKLYRQAGRKSFDIVNIHPFLLPQNPQALTHLRGIYVSTTRIMAEFDDAAKPIWMTEIGCPGVVTPSSTNGWWCGPSPTEAQQAKWVETIYANALGWKGVGKIFWAFFRETDYFHDGVSTFGLVRDDFSEKPAYHAYHRVATARQ